MRLEKRQKLRGINKSKAAKIMSKAMFVYKLIDVGRSERWGEGMQLAFCDSRRKGYFVHFIKVSLHKKILAIP
jgi:hypothetical protein